MEYRELSRSVIKTMVVAAGILLCFVTGSRAGEDGAGKIINTTAVPGGPRVKDPQVTERYDYYEVCGCCEKDVQCDMSAKAPGWRDGNKYDSITKWKVRWDYDHSSAGNACATDSFRLSMEITYQFPKWVCSGQASQALAERWEKYIRNLTLHEKGHREKALKAAEEITKAVAEMPSASSCAELDRKVQRLCRDRLKQLDEEQAEYDESTDHGQVTGITFP